KYVWVPCLLLTCINLLIFSWTARQTLRSRPELAEGYRKLLIGCSIVLNLPWVLMGIGCVASDITVWHYFRIREWNPFVLAWWGCLVLEWIAGFYWLFFRPGAAFFVDHRDLWGPWNARMPSTPWLLKLLYVVCVLGGVLALGMSL